MKSVKNYWLLCNFFSKYLLQLYNVSVVVHFPDNYHRQNNIHGNVIYIQQIQFMYFRLNFSNLSKRMLCVTLSKHWITLLSTKALSVLHRMGIQTTGKEQPPQFSCTGPTILRGRFCYSHYINVLKHIWNVCDFANRVQSTAKQRYTHKKKEKPIRI